MEEGHVAVRDLSRNHPRAPSRASTNPASRRTGAQSAGPSISHASASPQLLSAHPVHRHYHASCSSPSVSGPPPRPSSRTTRQPTREGSSESVRQTAVSSFLQEKLLKERKADSLKSGHTSLSRTNSDVSNSLEQSSLHQRSPGKNGDKDAVRPGSSGGSDVGKKTGMGLKEMEQTVSGLHKQNFDLKLELYHRREKQSMLEERMEALENEKVEAEDINDRLLEELERRDKAVEEAVSMIVMLEAKIEALVDERSKVRLVESNSYQTPGPFDVAPGTPAPPPKPLAVIRMEDDAKALTRMPSFLSERTETTENLRRVYLGARGSLLSFARDTSENLALHSLASPSLSSLSESSFSSVYGHTEQGVEGQEVQTTLDGPSKVDLTPRKASIPKLERHTETPKPSSVSRTSLSGQFQPIASIVSGSPLQRIERMDPSYVQKREASRPPSSGRDFRSGSASRSPGHVRTKEEKREALRKVMTDVSGGASLHEAALPPTPDTMSSSMLRRYKNSSDTLSRRQELREGRSHGSISNKNGSNEKLAGAPIGPPPAPKQNVLPVPQKLEIVNGSYNQQPLSQPTPRPRSADDSTLSHHRRGNSWDLESEISETDSLESSLDIWLRMAGKPHRELERGGKTSPDLFGFPTNDVSGAWSMNAMFGPNTSNTYGGGSTVGRNSEQLQNLVAAQRALFGPPGPPPPPDRRSSLNAQTKTDPQSSEPATTAPTAPTAPANVNSVKPGTRRPRFPRRNSDDARMRASMKTPTPGDFTQPPTGEQKRSQYPPITGQPAARNGNGLVRLFRRSLSGVSTGGIFDSNSTSNANEPPAEHPDPAKNVQAPGPPAWISRSGVLDDERSSSTPPPIQRDPRARQISMPAGEVQGNPALQVGTEIPAGVALSNDEAPTTQQQCGDSQPVSAGTGARRKWLPNFGRSNSLKNKTS